MKLLLDENLSIKLAHLLEPTFGEVVHVSDILKFGANDRDIWETAKKDNAVIVSKDDDFRQMAILHGFPPKLIWLRCGNSTTAQIATILIDSALRIEHFFVDEEQAVLVLS